MKWELDISGGDHTIVGEGNYNIYRIYLRLRSQDRPFYELYVCAKKTQEDTAIAPLILYAEENEKKLRLADEASSQEERDKEAIIKSVFRRIPSILKNNGF